MKNKKSIFIFIVFFVVFILFFSIEGVCVTTQLIDGMNPETALNSDPTADSRILTIIAQAFSIIQFIGTGISIIMVMWLGITYMISSIEEKAEIKKRAVPIVVGSVLIVATVNILKIVQQVVVDSIK